MFAGMVKAVLGGAGTGVLGSVVNSRSTTMAHPDTYKFFYKLAAFIAAELEFHQSLMVLVGAFEESA